METSGPSTTRGSGLPPEVNQPGLGRLRTASRDARRGARDAAKLARDAVSGLTVAVASVPDGMANGLLAGVNPIFGLYASFVGPIVGGLLSSTHLMIVTTTSAASLMTSRALAGLPPDSSGNALAVLAIVIGAVQILSGLLRLGRLARFVSFSVMTGFLSGVSVLLVLSQLPTITGYPAKGDSKLAQTVDLLRNLGAVDLVSLGLAASTVALSLGFSLGRLRHFANLIGMAAPSVIAAVLHLGTVRIVSDVGEISGGIPMPSFPSFEDAVNLLTAACSIALVILVQGAGVSQSVPNPNGSPRSVSKDFIAQGGANIAVGLLQGLPVGGAVGETAVNVAGGARRRWSAVFSGLWMAVVLLLIPGLVSSVAMPALAAVLLLAGVRSVRTADLALVGRAGWPSVVACAVTFLATIILPIQAAVGLGVLVSGVLYINKASTDLSVVALVKRADGRTEERVPARVLSSDSVTVLSVYGDLFYAGARTLGRLLPSPEGSRNPAVVIRLRGRSAVGATLVDVLARYSHDVEAAGGRLYLSGITRDVRNDLVSAGRFGLKGPLNTYEASPVLGESTEEAVADAEAWLVERLA